MSATKFGVLFRIIVRFKSHLDFNNIGDNVNVERIHYKKKKQSVPKTLYSFTLASTLDECM